MSLLDYGRVADYPVAECSTNSFLGDTLMRVTTQGEYGVRCLLLLAKQPADKFVPISELAEREQLSKEYVEQLMLRLRRAGIVTSTRGVRGGYQLALPPQEITLRRILEVLEGDTFEIICERLNDDEKNCVSYYCGCSVRPIWRHLKRMIDVILEQITLEMMLLDEENLEPRLRAICVPPQTEFAAR